ITALALNLLLHVTQDAGPSLRRGRHSARDSHVVLRPALLVRQASLRRSLQSNDRALYGHQEAGGLLLVVNLEIVAGHAIEVHDAHLVRLDHISAIPLELTEVVHGDELLRFARDVEIDTPEPHVLNGRETRSTLAARPWQAIDLNADIALD